MAVGDRVLFLRNERGLGVKNGTLGELRSLRGSVLEVQLDEAGKRGAGALIQFDLRDYASLDHGYATTIHKSQGTTVGRSYVLASAAMDRHATYVALTRTPGRTDLHYGRDEFRDDADLAARLGRERAKDTTLDYAREEPPMARSGDQPQGGPQQRQAAAQDRDRPAGSAGGTLGGERQQPSGAAENSRSDAQNGAERREGELVESAGRDGRRDTARDGDRSNDSPLDQRTRAAVQRIKERLRDERDPCATGSAAGSRRPGTGARPRSVQGPRGALAGRSGAWPMTMTRRQLAAEWRERQRVHRDGAAGRKPKRWPRSAPATPRRSSGGSCCPVSSPRPHPSAARRTCSASRRARC